MKTLFAVVYNLLKNDFEDEAKVEKIEGAVLEALNHYYNSRITSKDIIFSFPSDPTVTTPTIPVVCDITLLPSSFSAKNDKAVDEIGRVLKMLFGNRGVQVIIREINGTIEAAYIY